MKGQKYNYNMGGILYAKTYKSSNYGSSVYVYKLGKKKLSLKEVLQLVQL